MDLERLINHLFVFANATELRPCHFDVKFHLDRVILDSSAKKKNILAAAYNIFKKKGQNRG